MVATNPVDGGRCDDIKSSTTPVVHQFLPVFGRGAQLPPISTLSAEATAGLGAFLWASDHNLDHGFSLHAARTTSPNDLPPRDVIRRLVSLSLSHTCYTLYSVFQWKNEVLRAMAFSDGTIYLDHAATTPVDPRVLDAMIPYFTDQFGNPGGIYNLGRRAAAALDDSREAVARVLHCRPTEVIFTAGGSESDNLAIKGIAAASRSRGKHIITSAIEHHAVLHTCQALEKDGYTVTYLPVDAQGRVRVEDVAAALTDETILVTIMLANNEIGTIQPIAAIGEICRARRIPFHTDAVQGGGVLDLDVTKLRVDALSLAAHKFYGPKGVGILYLRTGTRIAPQIQGGSQERNRRAGTENVAGIVGAATALTLMYAESATENARLIGLRDRLIAGVLAIPDTQITGHPTERLPNNASFAIRGIEGESLLLNLDIAGIAASSGSACTSAIVDPSHVLVALGLDDAWNRGHLRLTVGHSTTEADVDAVVAQLPAMVAALRALSSRPAATRS